MNPGILSLALLLAAGDFTEPVEVRHDDKLCLSYRARWSGDYLVVRADIEPGWHTFAMDNVKRQEEKLAGKPSLGVERPTEIKVAGGLTPAGAWLQTAPKDFSKPEIQWFSWGFEQQAVFAVKARRTGDAPAQLAIRGQACTESICKNIDVTLTVPVSGATAAFDPKSLIAVR